MLNSYLNSKIKYFLSFLLNYFINLNEIHKYSDKNPKVDIVIHLITSLRENDLIMSEIIVIMGFQICS